MPADDNCHLNYDDFTSIQYDATLNGKWLFCLCEDLTEDHISAAIDVGFRDLESLDEGAFTGPCQGKIWQ
jgi:hypothetical protein